VFSISLVRKIHSDIVNVDVLSRMQASEIQSQVNNQLLDRSDDNKRDADLYYNDRLLPGHEEEVGAIEKPGRLSEDVRNFNKQKNHFSKSTAEESDMGVKDLECLLEERDGQPSPLEGAVHQTINNRKSKSVASLDFV
jgi:hypothetical protein